MTLYQTIKSYPAEGSLRELFNSLKLSDGYELIEKIDCTADEMLLIVKFMVESIDPESTLHETFKIRKDLNRAILKSYGIKEKGVWKQILNNENEPYKELVKWYYRQIQDYYSQAIVACQDVIEQQLDASTIKIGKYQMDGDTSTKIEDDKYFKAMNYQNACLNNAIDNIKKLDELKTIRLKRFERTDDAIKEEMFNASGEAEQQALLAKLLRDKK